MSSQLGELITLTYQVVWVCREESLHMYYSPLIDSCGSEAIIIAPPFEWQLWVQGDHHCPSLWVTAVGPRWSSLPLPLRALNSAQGLAALAGQHRTRGKGWIFLPSFFPISFFEGERWRRGFWSWPLRIRKSVPEKSREQRVSIRSSKKKALFGDRKVEA